MERLLQRDVVVRVLSVVLAVMVWIMVTDGQAQTARRSLVVPLAVLDQDPNLRRVAGGLPETVQVELTGTGREINRLGADDLTAQLNLAGRRSGVHTVRVEVKGVPQGVEAAIRPEVVTVTLERHEDRSLAVTLPQPERIVGDYRYRLDLKEQKVLAAGLVPDLNRVTQVVVVPELDGVTESSSVRAPVRALDAGGVEVPNVSLSPATVAVGVQVTVLPPAKSVTVRPNPAGSPPPGFGHKMRVEPAQVTVRGPRQFHSGWHEVLTAPINLSGQTRSFTVQVELVKPAGAETIDPDTVTVAVDIVELRMSREFTGQAIAVVNLGPNLKAQVLPLTATVRVFGPKRLLDALDPRFLLLNADVRNLGPGQYTLPINFSRATGVDIEVEPATVAVDITSSGGPTGAEPPPPGDPPA